MNNQTWTLEKITPEMAKKYLTRNMVNRPISSGTVRSYADDMINGRWDINTTACIAFNDKGDLKDGQHRLTAIILAGIPVLMWVCRGVGDHVVFDSGRNRKISDYMHIEHPDLDPVFHNNIALSMIKYLILHQKPNQKYIRSRTSPHETESFIFEHKEDLDKFFGGFNFTKKAKLSVTCIVLSMYMAYMGGVEMEELSHFFSVLISGMGEGSKDYPIIAYRNYLLDRDSTVPATDIEIRKCQGAIKKYLSGSGLKRIYEPKELIWDFPYKKEE
jgi:hypothetical protein